MLGPEIFEYLIDYPAWLIGTLAGGLIYLAVATAGLIAAVYAGISVHNAVRLPLVNWIAAIIVGLWIAGVSARSLTWVAAGIFSSIKDHNE